MPHRNHANLTGPPLTGLWLAVWGFGALINLLMLTGPVFMLQVYDRVLPAQSTPTLVALIGMVAFLFAAMAAIDAARAKLLARIGATLVVENEAKVFTAMMRAKLRAPPDPRAAKAMTDLEAVRKIFATTAIQGVLDAPWSLAFMGVLFALHPSMGTLALAGGLVLLSLALLTQWQMKEPRRFAQVSSAHAETIRKTALTQAPDLVAQGMEPALRDRWLLERRRALQATLVSADRHASSSSVARALRLFLQSAMLALGAWLVLGDALSPGLMVASSIMMGRVLAPVEQMATQWPALRDSHRGWRRLRGFLAASQSNDTASVLARNGALSVSNLVVASPLGGAPLLRLSGFSVAPGEALGVIGTSGAGKSVLARSLIGGMPIAAGTMRLGDVSLPLEPGCGVQLGYLAQPVALVPGTLHDYIARFDAQANMQAVSQAASDLGLHQTIMNLPQGYSTEIGPAGEPLSGGALQRLGLARTIYNAPGLAIFDEPAAHLDADGISLFSRAIASLKDQGSIVIILSQRPVAIEQCDSLLMLENGTQVAFGPRDAVLRDRVKNHAQIVTRSLGASSA